MIEHQTYITIYKHEEPSFADLNEKFTKLGYYWEPTNEETDAERNIIGRFWKNSLDCPLYL